MITIRMEFVVSKMILIGTKISLASIVHVKRITFKKRIS